MACYFRKSDTIVVELSFLPKIVKYRLHSVDGSSAGVALSILGRKRVQELLYLTFQNSKPPIPEFAHAKYSSHAPLAIGLAVPEWLLEYSIFL